MRPAVWNHKLYLVMLLAFLLVPEARLVAQIGPYPGGGYPGGYPPYPGGGYPGGGGVGIPGIPMPRIPGRRRRGTTRPPADSSRQVTYEGILSKLDDSALIMKLDDGRTLNIKRSDKTKFYKGSKEIAPSEFHAGDHISVNATEDKESFLYALKVTFEKAGTEADRKRAALESPQASSNQQDGRPTLKRSSKPEVQPPQASDTAAAGSPPAASGDSAQKIAEPPMPDFGNDGPPVLRRGKPYPTQQAQEQQPPSPAVSDSHPQFGQQPVAAPAVPGISQARLDTRPEDPLIERAREAVFSFSRKLPNFICREYMARYSRYDNISGWRPLDVVSADIVYDNGEEHYRDLKINDQPTHRKIEELSGSWSTGEFATTLNDLFYPATATRFRAGGESMMNGVRARVYDFTVQQQHSHWVVQEGSQSLAAAYQGSVWIDPETARVVRVEIQARDLPSDFPLDQVETAVDYSWVRIGSNSALLPVHAETLGCQRGGSACSHNVIDFRNYRKYTTDTKITY